MKEFLSSLLCAVAVQASDMWTGSTVINPSDVGKAAVVLLKNPTKTTDNNIWTISTQTILDMDTGYRWLRVTHELTAKIQATDVVTFDLTFSSDYDLWVDPLNNMIDDSGRCSVS